VLSSSALAIRCDNERFIARWPKPAMDLVTKTSSGIMSSKTVEGKRQIKARQANRGGR
jgi:hypothetical protein